jgi:four helix bundle protein
MENKTIKDIAIELTVETTFICDNIKGRSVFVNQILKSCSSIGANSAEAKYAQSTADFIHKLEISLKECYETDYWLRLLHETSYLADDAFLSIYTDCQELERLLISIVKTSKE